MEESEREKGRKENMRCKVSSSLSLHVESKKMKNFVDFCGLMWIFPKLRLDKSLNNLILHFNN